MQRIALLRDNLGFARGYTIELLGDIPVSDWFRMPEGCPSHIAWQVGHLALAEARLVVNRAGGRDFFADGLMDESYLTLFGRTSPADGNAAKYPSADEIRRVLDRVHAAALQTLESLSDDDLETHSPGPEHRFCRTKFDFIRWCSHHEFLHTGQIGLIRRLLGHAPVW